MEQRLDSPHRPNGARLCGRFCVGEDDKHIHPVDAQGVAFAALQGLYQLLRKKDAETKSVYLQLQQLEEENEMLNERIATLECSAAFAVVKKEQK